MVQTNFFSRTYDPNANSGSGNEQKHELEFSTTDTFASYSFRWRKGRLDWWVNDRLLRTATACEGGPRIPDPEQVSLKIHANIWAVNKQAEEWAGPLDPSFYETAAKYLWIWYEPGENCNIKSDCGTIPQGV
jgi:beta-glucanase (GH16 family)